MLRKISAREITSLLVAAASFFGALATVLDCERKTDTMQVAIQALAEQVYE